MLSQMLMVMFLFSPSVGNMRHWWVFVYLYELPLPYHTYDWSTIFNDGYDNDELVVLGPSNARLRLLVPVGA